MIYITGDTHIPYDIHKLNTKRFTEGKNLTKNDYVIVCGDFGIPWTPNSRDEQYWTKWLNNKPWTTLFIEGNHDSYAELKKLNTIDMFDNKVDVVSDSIFHLRRGEIYIIDNSSFFCFGGARSIDRHLRCEGLDWWPEEECTYDECQYAIDNLKEYEDYADVIITHTCPEMFVPFADKKYDAQARFFNYIYDNIKFKKWYCGHMHIDKKSTSGIRFLYNDIEKVVF